MHMEAGLISRLKLEALGCLAAGAGLLAFTAFMPPSVATALAAWLHLILLLRFTRLTPAWRGWIVLSVLFGAVSWFSLKGVIPVGPTEYAITVLVGGVFSALPYLIDRLVSPRLHSGLSLVVFPAALAALSFVGAMGNPFGTWGDLAYTQTPLPALMQTTALAGLSGLNVLMGLAASAINHAWTRAGHGWRALTPVGALAAVVAALACWGAMRLNQTSGDDIVAAAIRRDVGVKTAFEICKRDDLACLAREARGAERILGDQTLQAAANGAKVVLWSEGAAQVLAADEAAMIARLGELAQAADIHLIAALAVIPEAPGPWQNKLVAIRPDGTTAWSYLKARPVPGEPITAGDGVVRWLDTPHGRIAAVICFDADFPDLIRQAGLADADLLLVAAADWPAIARVHADMAVVRGIETGAAVLRSASGGVSLAADRNGRVLARSDQKANTLIVDIPMRGEATPYARLGDIIGWGATGLIVLLGLSTAALAAWRRLRRKQPAA